MKNSKKLISVIAIILFIAFLALFLVGFGGTRTIPLAEDEIEHRFEFKNGEFIIVQMTDFHQWMGEELDPIGYNAYDTLAPVLVNYINNVLDEVSPDLVVITGDNIFSQSWWGDAFEQISLKTYEKIAQIFEEKQQYWTLTFGNHDSESACTKSDFMNQLINHKYFVGGFESGADYEAITFPDGDENRVGNHALPIYADGKIAYAVYTLDSGSNSKVVHEAPYRYILPEQTEWYRDMEALFKNNNNGIPVPGIMFTHIPVIEMGEAFNQNNIGIGRYYGISPSDVRSDIFEAAFEGDVKGFFFGHNHANSCTTFYVRGDKKMMMGVTPQATANYDSDDTERLRSRVIKLQSDGGFFTFIHTSNKTEKYGFVEYGEILDYND